MKLEDIRKDAAISGLEPGQVVRIVTTEPVGDNALTVYYKTTGGRLSERMLFRTDEVTLSLAEAGRPWAFDAPGEDFKLAVEATRINLAYLFDPMMAVHTSNVTPLPHQITAVYQSMLPRQPLRYVLADDPGAGKTIMAGLFIRELLMRADARRVLIVAPGSLVEQWQDEMDEKFGLRFALFSREQVEQSRSGNPFEDVDLLVARVDQLSRSEDLQEKLRLSRWDLIVVDEAHKLSASYFGNKINKTKRFLLVELLGSITRHFLLMTATPHNGKEEDFQLFLSLLDSDRFYGKFRDGAHKVDISDLMRRMVKEDLLKFDGTPLFPERRAYTLNYKLSNPEAALYNTVTDYVKEEMNRADQLEGQRKGTVGFAQMVNDPSESVPGDRRTRSWKDAVKIERERLFGILERLVLWENTNNEAVLNEARAEIWKSWRETCELNKNLGARASSPQEAAKMAALQELFNPDKLPAFHDPFAGGGALPLEAQRLGLEAYASDLNPVAVTINKAMIEIPPRFTGRTPVGPLPPGEKKNVDMHEDWSGARGLAEDVRRYGAWMRSEAEKRIGHLYPKIEITAEMAVERPDLKPLVGQKLTVIAWLWARTVRSPNPAFSHADVPLASTFVLSSKEGKEAYVEPVVEGDSYRFTVKVGTPPESAKGGTKLARGANFRCLLSDMPIDPKYIKAEGVARRLGQRLMAVVAEGVRGRIYLSPTELHEAIARQVQPEWKPETPLPDDPRNFWTLNYGLSKFSDLFTPRQLVALTTFSDLVQEAIEKCKANYLGARASRPQKTWHTRGY